MWTALNWMRHAQAEAQRAVIVAELASLEAAAADTAALLAQSREALALARAELI